MARPKSKTPTPAELAVLKVLWEHGPCTVREVLQHLPSDRKRAYTSVMTLLSVMTEKGMLLRKSSGRAFVYSAKGDQDSTLGKIMGEMLGRAFDGSASTLVAHLLQQSSPNPDELDQIHKAIEHYRREHHS